MKEEDLYEPIKKALEEKFKAFGKISLEITGRKISEEIKKFLSNDAVSILETEKSRPDLIGCLTLKDKVLSIPIIQRSNILQIRSRTTPRIRFPGEKKLIIVEVKEGNLEFKHIYQTKKYAEMLLPDFVFLIGTKNFTEARRRFLMKHPLLKYPVLGKTFTYRSGIFFDLPTDVRNIHTLVFDGKNLNLDEGINYTDPFIKI